jgi:GR25 family glycosyltransferase involved in LPS biosynthesis
MKAVLINRADRPERLKESQRQFEQYGMEVEVFPAVISNPGWKGCRDSHLAVLEKYKDERFIMIFEDDVLFLEDPMQPIAKVIEELPQNWDMLYLGISPSQKYEKFSPHLYRVNGGYTTHAILWHNRPNGAVNFALSHRKDILKIDVFLGATVHKIFNCFVIYPLLCTQRQEKSDTCHRSDAGSIIRNYNKFIV